jgi:hypothetical protein
VITRGKAILIDGENIIDIIDENTIPHEAKKDRSEWC